MGVHARENDKIASQIDDSSKSLSQKKPPAYKIRNKMFLSTKNIRTERLLKKLDNKNIDLFKIKKLVGLLYQLELPHTMKIYDVFYPNLL